MTQTVVRYRVKPDQAEENARLVRDVYEELAGVQPDGFRYVTFVLEDGVSFVHVAFDEDETQPLQQIAAFGRFQADIRERLDEGPVASKAEVVGSYGFGL
jgi:hypothetical protein